MKAIVCRAYGPVDALQWMEVAPAPLGPGQVRVAIHAAGVNFADTLKVQGLHQVKPPLPWIPGAELAGVVSEIGAGVEGLRVGDPVLGVPDDRAGGFAESVVLEAGRVLPLLEGLDFIRAAALPAAYGTALYALRQRARLAAGDCVLVLGAAGGVGLAATQVAAAMGARVIAAASTPEKRDLAVAHGAHFSVDYTQPGWRHQVLELAGSTGVRVVFDPVGGEIFDEAIRIVGWGGRYLVVGFAAGRIPELRMNHPLVKGYEVVGVRYDVWRDREWPEARRNLEQVLDWCRQDALRPMVSRTQAMADAVQALSAIAGRQALGKLVLRAG